MKPLNQGCQPSRLRVSLVAAVAVTALMACGGGAGQTDIEKTANAAPANPLSTSIGDFKDQIKVPQSFRAASEMPGGAVAAAAAALPADAGPTYLKVWIVDAINSESQTLSLGRYTPGQALPSVQPPNTATKVFFEVYNGAGSSSGEWVLK